MTTHNGQLRDYLHILNDLIWINKSIGSKKVSPTRTESKIGTPSLTWTVIYKTTPSGTRKPQNGAASGDERQPGVDFFASLGSGFARIFGQTDSIKEKTLCSTHFHSTVEVRTMRVEVSFCVTKTK